MHREEGGDRQTLTTLDFKAFHKCHMYTQRS